MKKLYGMIVSGVFELASVFSVSVLIIALIFTFAFRLVGVDGTSMLPTLDNGDWLITSVSNKDYNFKDIVIVVQPGLLNEPLVKRVIATEGQWIDVDYENGQLLIGWSENDLRAVSEDYVSEPASIRFQDDTNEYPILVPEGCVFVMGDNRNASTDSRSYLVGFIDENYILGKAEYRLFSGVSGFDTEKMSIY